MKKYKMNNKGATLGVTIVLILFLTIIAFIVMSMSAIITSTVIKNDKAADQYLALQQQGQGYLNELSLIANESYILFDSNNDNDFDYYDVVSEKINSYILRLTDNVILSYDSEHHVVTYQITDSITNKKLEVTLVARSYSNIKDIIENGDSNEAYPFFEVTNWLLISQ
jgi:Na+-transporting methylmalonyl-CoA/oxaloacetate decarboxylase gamma subunit